MLDLSSSISPYLPQVKKSASDLVDALRGAPNEVGVVTFGTSASVAAPIVDVHDDGTRARLKELIDGIGLPADGATNWEEALSTAESLDPSVVLFLTDGLPTAHGTSSTGYTDATDNLAPAVQVADEMRRTGTRIVGVGMGLQPDAVPNLVQVTGPVVGDDYYETSSDAAGLLDKLYDVASKTCGIPVADLPQPEGGHFPVVPVIVGTLAAALVVGIAGLLVSRRRHATLRHPATITGTRSGPLARRTVRAADVAKVTAEATGAPQREPSPPVGDLSPPEPRPATSGRMSLAWLQGDDYVDADAPAEPKPPRTPGRSSLSWLHDDGHTPTVGADGSEEHGRRAGEDRRS